MNNFVRQIVPYAIVAAGVMAKETIWHMFFGGTTHQIVFRQSGRTHTMTINTGLEQTGLQVFRKIREAQLAVEVRIPQVITMQALCILVYHIGCMIIHRAQYTPFGLK